MLDYNNIEVMCLQLIRLRIVSVDNTIAMTKRTSIYTKIQKHEFKTTKINSDEKVQETIIWISRQIIFALRFYTVGLLYELSRRR